MEDNVLKKGEVKEIMKKERERERGREREREKQYCQN